MYYSVDWTVAWPFVVNGPHATMWMDRTANGAVQQLFEWVFMKLPSRCWNPSSCSVNGLTYENEKLEMRLEPPAVRWVGTVQRGRAENEQWELRDGHCRWATGNMNEQRTEGTDDEWTDRFRRNEASTGVSAVHLSVHTEKKKKEKKPFNQICFLLAQTNRMRWRSRRQHPRHERRRSSRSNSWWRRSVGSKRFLMGLRSPAVAYPALVSRLTRRNSCPRSWRTWTSGAWTSSPCQSTHITDLSPASCMPSSRYGVSYFLTDKVYSLFTCITAPLFYSQLLWLFCN